MKTNEFLSLLEQNPNKELLFEYAPGKLVKANYHITEIKNITVDSVDCGAGTDFWKETVIQLWESPEELGKMDFMHTNKALEILSRVDRIKPMEKEVEVKFEFSNDTFHTAQLFVNSYAIKDEQLLLHLGINQTDCKAKETCGVAVEVASVSENSCSPESGCC